MTAAHAHLGQLPDVHIRQLPLKVWARTQEHIDELLREFALITVEMQDDTGAKPDIPKRLLDLIEQLTERFAGVNTEADNVRDEAYARGDEYVDLTLRLPAVAREATIELGQLLDEADDYCRAGDKLLTLATPPESLAFRRWYLEEVLRQLDGEAPVPWPESEHARSF